MKHKDKMKILPIFLPKVFMVFDWIDVSKFSDLFQTFTLEEIEMQFFKKQTKP